MNRIEIKLDALLSKLKEPEAFEQINTDPPSPEPLLKTQVPAPPPIPEPGKKRSSLHLFS